MHVNVFDFSELLARLQERYLEFVRVSAFSVGIYMFWIAGERTCRHRTPRTRSIMWSAGMQK
jgi:hypothetical protein